MKRALVLILFCFSTAAAQYSIEILFVSHPERTRYIATFRHNNIVYGSLNDLGEAFKLRIRPDPHATHIELRTDRYSLRATTNSPFVLISDSDGKPQALQLTTDVLFAARSFFAPLEDFMPILDAVLDEEVVYNPTLNLIAVGEPFPSPQFALDTLSIEERANGNLVRLHLNRYIANYESWLKPIESERTPGEDYWLYVTLAGATADTAALQSIKPHGLIKQILVIQSPTSTQLTFRLHGRVTGTEMLKAEESDDLLLAIHTPTAEEIAKKRRAEIEKSLERERSKWDLDVVVIDAGHGGKDPGATGVTRTREKDIALAIALKLGRLIQKRLRGVKVVYTRTEDEFVELYRRGQIANQANGKLFVSIHCNSMPSRPNPARGFEIYLLRPGKTEHAIEIAERENAVIELEEDKGRYQELTEENFILLTMAQTAYMRYSEQFADILQQEMEAYSGLDNQGVKQAGFQVLVGASMPNVLVETGYLSNREDERFLRSSRGQDRIAQAVLGAVKRYKEEYEKTLQEGKMVGGGE